MIALVLCFIAISSGSIFAAVFFSKKYEEVVSITVSSIIFFLFISGFFGVLNLGAIIVAILSFALPIFALVYSIKNRTFKELCSRIFTPAFFIFVLFYVFAFYFNYNRMASSWDEFSHWADIVKVMVTLDDFGTNVNSHSTFQSYPPGMSLFQYFYQKINFWVSREVLSEWLLYVPYQVFGFSFILPFLGKLTFKRKINIPLTAIIIFLSMSTFFTTYYTSLYIDPILSILSGVGIASVFLTEKKNLMYRLNIYSICVMLVLMKDAGLMFSAIIAIVYIIDIFVFENDIERIKKIKNSLLVIVSVALPKVLWNVHLRITGAEIEFSNPIEWGVLINNLLGRDESYRQVVKQNFFEAMATRSYSVGDTGISINYYLLFAAMLLGSYFLTEVYRKNHNWDKRKTHLILAVVTIQYVVYVLGLCVTYMFKFSEYEAENLASFERYLYIEYFAIFIFVFIVAIKLILDKKDKLQFWLVILLLIQLTFTLMLPMHKYISRSSVGESRYTRSVYEEIANQIELYVSEDSSVYCLSQESTGFDFWVMRFNARPRTVNDTFGSWSVGEAFYEGDVWTRKMTSDEFINVLCEEYDYLAIYKLNDYFLGEFEALFENPNEIQENRVYKVNTSTGLLELCK